VKNVLDITEVRGQKGGNGDPAESIGIANHLARPDEKCKCISEKVCSDKHNRKLKQPPDQESDHG
jgi:hypothetical protein